MLKKYLKNGNKRRANEGEFMLKDEKYTEIHIIVHI